MATERGNGIRPIALLIDLAAEHQGLLTRAQLLDAGLTRNFIDGRVKCSCCEDQICGVPEAALGISINTGRIVRRMALGVDARAAGFQAAGRNPVSASRCRSPSCGI